MQNHVFDTGMFVDFSSKIAANIHIEEHYYDQDQPELVTDLHVSFSPIFTEVNSQISELGIVLSLYQLWLSTQQPGAYNLLTCTCGEEEHAGIYSPVYVSFPDENTIVWELCGTGLKWALEEIWHKEGFMRLIFKREQYEAGVIAMIAQLKNLIASPFTVDDISLEPDYYGGLAVDFFDALNLSVGVARKLVFEANSVIEIGAFEASIYRINQQNGDKWISHYFSHWAVNQAFDEWSILSSRGRCTNPTFILNRYQDDVLRGDLVIDKVTSQYQANHFYLVRAVSDYVVHAAGERFAQLFQQSINEGGFGEGIKVIYRPVDEPAILG